MHRLWWWLWMLCPPWRTVDKLASEIARLEAQMLGVYREAVDDSLIRHWPAFWADWRRRMWGDE